MKSRIKFLLQGKKYISDFSYNILASLVVTGILQLIVYPYLAKTFDSSIYGLILISMGIINSFSLSVGNSLNNTRLIQNTDYIDKKIEGDFNIIINLFSSILMIIVLILGIFYFQFSIIISILISILCFLISLRAYYVVIFRINLDFKRFFYYKLIVGFCYIIGIIFVYFFNLWPIVFILPELILLFLIKKKYNIFEEKKFLP